MADYAQQNLRRLMARQGLSVDQLARSAGVDRRTIRGILRGTNQPRARTLKILADALGVPVDEFFLDPARLVHRCFDRHTNPMVDEVVESHPQLFANWAEEDFADLHSRVGTGGPLTQQGAVAAAEEINLRRSLSERLSLLVETGQGLVIQTFFDALEKQHVLVRP